MLATFNNPTPSKFDYFGFSVAAVGTDRVLIGAHLDDTGADEAGAAYLFGLESYTPGLVADVVNARSITATSLEDGAVNSAKLAAGAVTLAKLSTTDALPGQALIFDGNMAAWVSPSADWSRAGNSAAPGEFLGTLNNQSFELRVNNAPALRLEPTASNSVNIVGGAAVNAVAPGVVGATIAGGGAGFFAGQPSPNRIDAHLGTISGGGQNTVQQGANSATIGGGWANAISMDAHGATIGGGTNNTVGARSAFATINGGHTGAIYGNAPGGVIGGGVRNYVEDLAAYSTVGGGYHNSILLRAERSTIAGGSSNIIRADAADATVSGGSANEIGVNALAAIVAGGWGNTIQNDAFHATVSGGQRNTASGRAATGGGGDGNQILADYATVAGGQSNVVKDVLSFIGGGRENAIEASGGIVWPHGRSTISGGEGNTIQSDASWSAIGGGKLNRIATNATISTIGGGAANEVGANASASTIGGGWLNRIWTDANYQTIGGGLFNEIQTSAFSGTIGGGQDNTIATEVSFGTIPGGYGAKARNFGQFAYASGYFVERGDAQTSVHVLRGTTTGAVTNELFLDGLNQRMVPPEGATWAYDALVVGRGSTGNSAAFRLKGFVKKVTGSISGLGTTEVLARDIATWSADARKNSGAGAFVITGTGSADETVRWVASVRTTEVLWSGLAAASHAASGLGQHHEDIAPGDAGSADFTAIEEPDEILQGRSQDSEARTQKLITENTELRRRLEALEQLVSKLATKGD